MPRFSLFRRGRIESSLELHDDVIRIGRLIGLEIRLDTATVSREHARIVRRGDDFILEDAGSVNGVAVGGQRVKSHKLDPGDSIVIEDYTIVFQPPLELFDSGSQQTVSSSVAGERKSNGGGDPDMTYMNIERFLPKE